ncbi:MAG: hypothetical protein AAFZ15_21710 [Bacteroidota bacterium]
MLKRILTVTSSLFIFLILNSFVFSKSPAAAGTSPSAYKIMEVTYLWELLSQDYEPNRNEDGTWLKSGFRSKYAMAKKYASLEILETTFGTKVFLRGPHDGEMNFNSNTSFGYYNPDFIKQVRAGVEQILMNPVYKKAAAKVYRDHLKNMATTYLDAYRFVNRDPNTLTKLKNGYIMDMARPEGIAGGSFQETFRPYAESLERDKGADIYEAFTAPAFWVRRSIDGTAASLFSLLEMVDKQLQ